MPINPSQLASITTLLKTIIGDITTWLMVSQSAVTSLWLSFRHFHSRDTSPVRDNSLTTKDELILTHFHFRKSTNPWTPCFPKPCIRSATCIDQWYQAPLVQSSLLTKQSIKFLFQTLSSGLFSESCFSCYQLGYKNSGLSCFRAR